MDLEKFIPYSSNILDDLYEVPNEELKTLSAEEFFKLPLNDEYKKRNPDSTLEKYCNVKDGIAEPANIEPEPIIPSTFTPHEEINSN